MSNVINFSVEISTAKKDVALKTMALIAAMAEVSMNDLMVAQIELHSDPEGEFSQGITAEQRAELDAHYADAVSSDDESVHASTVVEVKGPKAPRKSRAKVKPVVEETEEETEEGNTPEDADEVKPKAPKKEREDSAVDAYQAKKAKEVKAEISVEDVRGLLKDVVQDNREEIKAKLGKLGASSVSTLPEDKYAEMYEYLESLK